MTQQHNIDLVEATCKEFNGKDGVYFNGTAAMVPPLDDEPGYQTFRDKWRYFRIAYFSKESEVFPGQHVSTNFVFDIRETLPRNVIIARIGGAFMAIDECERIGRETGKPQ